MSDTKAFQLTYATMFNPPEELHQRFEQALEKAKSSLGKEHSLLIDGKEVFSKEKFEKRSPANTDLVLGVFQKGTAQDAEAALQAARKAFPQWSRTPWQERVRLMRKAADIIDQRLFDMGAAMTLEVGKNRMEALGDIAEVSALVRYACDQMEKNDGFMVQMGNDPLQGYVSRNVSILRPYGVWVVISPFNFPGALTGGPSGAALVAGNTLVIKPATDTPWTPRLLAQCFQDAGLPEGVVNFVTGPGSTLGQALTDSPLVDGVTFTGSYPVGMKLYRSFAQRNHIHPVILEMGGKNAAIVTRNANLDDAVTGIVRSAFGLQGQKCSACSRVLIEAPVYDEMVSRLVQQTEKLTIGDPTRREISFGPVINRNAYQDYQEYSRQLNQASEVVTGGRVLTNGEMAKGYFCAPTLATDLPLDHPLWKTEMFLPIATIARIDSLETGIQIANQVDYGLTGGIYGSPDEVDRYFDQIEVGVAYSNRPQGASTGAWPGFQPFGGWKASGASGKNAGGPYYLQLYMHEQINNRVQRA